MVKRNILTILFIILAVVAVQENALAASRSVAYFEVGFSGRKDKVVVKVRNIERIREARKILSKKERRSVMGKIVKSKASYNPRWSYHLSPSSINFFELAIEVCDLSPRLVEKNLKEIGGSVLPNGVWCPWSSYLKREVRRPV